MSQRNCGGTEQLSPTLYHSGLSGDLLAVAVEFSTRDGLEALWVAGYSMGGNLVLRMAGEVSGDLPALKGSQPYTQVSIPPPAWTRLSVGRIGSITVSF